MRISNAIKPLLYIAIGAIVALLLFKRCGSDPVKPQIVKPETIVKQVEAKEKSYKKEYDSLQVAYANLKASTATLKTKLIREQEKTAVLGADLQVVTGVNKDNEYEAGKLRDYIEQVKTTDSACNDVIAVLEAEIVNRDSAIDLKEQFNRELRESFDLMADNQGKLIKYNNQLQKQVRKKKFGATVWKIAALAAGVFILQDKLIK